jgi:hypothetical protein
MTPPLSLTTCTSPSQDLHYTLQYTVPLYHVHHTPQYHSVPFYATLHITNTSFLVHSYSQLCTWGHIHLIHTHSLTYIPSHALAYSFTHTYPNHLPTNPTSLIIKLDIHFTTTILPHSSIIYIHTHIFTLRITTAVRLPHASLLTLMNRYSGIFSTEKKERENQIFRERCGGKWRDENDTNGMLWCCVYNGYSGIAMCVVGFDDNYWWWFRPLRCHGNTPGGSISKLKKQWCIIQQKLNSEIHWHTSTGCYLINSLVRDISYLGLSHPYIVTVVCITLMLVVWNHC